VVFSFQSGELNSTPTVVDSGLSILAGGCGQDKLASGPATMMASCGSVAEQFGRRPVTAIDDLNSQQFYHGTKADLKLGDLIKPGYKL
jgi:hypothetical protein